MIDINVHLKKAVAYKEQLMRDRSELGMFDGVGNPLDLIVGFLSHSQHWCD